MQNTTEVRVPYENDIEKGTAIYNASGELVRTEYPNGVVDHYERVRREYSNGTVWYFENGERVRIEWPDGAVWHYRNGRVVQTEQREEK